MTTSESYVAGRIKRSRSTKAEVEARRDALVAIIRESAPTGVRFCYYRATSQGLVPKTQNGYNSIQRDILALRKAGRVGWADIVDSTRWMRKPRTHKSMTEALDELAETYRRDIWDTASTLVEVWVESESVAGVIGGVTDWWQVPLYPMKGQSSASFCWGAARQYAADRRPIHIIYLGDHDPAGLQIERNLQDKLTEFSGRDDIRVERLACTPEQISSWSLQGTKPKQRTWFDCVTGERHPFVGEAVEVEAIDPPVLRQLVDDAIASYVDAAQVQQVADIEAMERATLAGVEEWLR